MRLEITLGANIRRLRDAADMTQEMLAAKAGIDMRYLGGIERGQENPTIGVIRDIAEVLKVHPSTLLVEQPRTRK